MDAPNNREQNHFSRLTDTARNNAIARGAEKPGWVDIWLAMCSHYEYAKILGERGVNVDDFKTEAGYIAHFHDDYLTYRDPAKMALVNEARVELLEKIENALGAIRIFGGATRDGDQGVLAEMVRATQNALSSLIRDSVKDMVEDSAEGMIKQEIQAELLDIAVERSVGRIAPLIVGDRADPSSMRNIKSALLQSLDSFLSYEVGAEDLAKEDDVIEILKEFRTAEHLMASPVDMVEYVIQHSGDVYKTLLYRNGLRHDGDITDMFDDKLPSLQMQQLVMDSFKYAHGRRAPEFTPAHMAFRLMRDTAVQVHLRALGIADLSAFEGKLHKHMEDSGIDVSQEGRITRHTAVGGDMGALVATLDKKHLAREGRMPDVLLHLIKSDEKIYKAFNKAGLTRAKLKQWREMYDPKDAAKPDEKKKKKEGFEIPDSVLEHLIEEYCQDFTALARKKKFDPLIGNEDVVESITTKLLKKGKKNPIVIAEPGVGKTKLLEGLAQAIVSGKAPREMIGSRLLMLDLHQMNNTPYIGIFESRILPIVKGIAERNATKKFPPILLGLDEFAEAMNAGAHSFSPGFKGMIKPYLTTGEIFLIAATTEDEYRSKVEKDPALGRRMQPVFMKEPDVEQTVNIVDGLKTGMYRHHHVRITKARVRETVEMAHRYIHTVKNPDKAIDLLDEACAIARKAGSGTLNSEHIVEATARKSNIPADFLSSSDNERYSNLERNLGKQVYDQEDACLSVAAAIKRAKAGFKDENAPIGNFLFLGPTGVGKTELTKALARFLFGNDQDFLTRFDMSEYMEKHAVARLIGAPPGYVGYEEGGLLIRTLRSKPFGVYLYDEVEKAHEDFFNVMLAPMSDGVITDGRGLKGDMRNAINVMTSNLGAADVRAEGAKRRLDPIKNPEEWAEMATPIYMNAARAFFRPEFLNRLDGIIPFSALKPRTMDRLVDRHLATTTGVLGKRYGLTLELAPAFRRAVIDKGFDVQYGARPLRRAWADIVETPMAEFLLKQGPRIIGKASSLTVDMPGNVAPEQDNVVASIGSAGVRRAQRPANGAGKPVFKLA